MGHFRLWLESLFLNWLEAEIKTKIGMRSTCPEKFKKRNECKKKKEKKGKSLNLFVWKDLIIGMQISSFNYLK